MVYVISHLPFFLWAGACFCSLVAHVFPWGQINNKKRCYHTTTWGAPFRTFNYSWMLVKHWIDSASWGACSCLMFVVLWCYCIWMDAFLFITFLFLAGCVIEEPLQVFCLCWIAEEGFSLGDVWLWLALAYSFSSFLSLCCHLPVVPLLVFLHLFEVPFSPASCVL